MRKLARESRREPRRETVIGEQDRASFVIFGFFERSRALGTAARSCLFERNTQSDERAMSVQRAHLIVVSGKIEAGSEAPFGSEGRTK